jgi:hypothetical protein
MPEQFLSLSNLGARILLRTLWVYLAISDPLNGIAISINRGFVRASLPRFLFIYYLYNYYTSFLAVCQEKCSLILKKFLSGPEGAEPTLNAPYFADFTIGLLDYFPNIHEIMFSTNAKVGGKIIYDYFVNPIREYCEKNDRRLAFCI